MSIIKCTKCGEEFSDNQNVECPSCKVIIAKTLDASAVMFYIKFYWKMYKEKHPSTFNLANCLIALIFILILLSIILLLVLPNNRISEPTINNKVVSTPYNNDNSNNEYSSKTWYKSAGETDGYDWMKMNMSQKNDIVKGILYDLKNQGYKFSADEYWYIDQLNQYYGSDATNSTKLSFAFSMVGVAGGKVTK